MREMFYLSHGGVLRQDGIYFLERMANENAKHNFPGGVRIF